MTARARRVVIVDEGCERCSGVGFYVGNLYARGLLVPTMVMCGCATFECDCAPDGETIDAPLVAKVATTVASLDVTLPPPSSTAPGHEPPPASSAYPGPLFPGDDHE